MSYFVINGGIVTKSFSRSLSCSMIDRSSLGSKRKKKSDAVTKHLFQVDRVDEILEGYRTFTALAAEVSTPGGSGIMSRGRPSKAAHEEDEDSAPRRSHTGTLEDYASLHLQDQQKEHHLQQQKRQASERRGRRGGGVPYFDPASDPVVVDALRLLFAKEGNYVQDLVRAD